MQGSRTQGSRTQGTATAPAGIRDVIASRLDQLPPSTRSLVRAAFVLGREFSPDLLSRVVDLSPGVVAAARRAADRLAYEQTVFQYQQALELLPSFLQGNKISSGETRKKEARPPRATPGGAPGHSGGRRPGPLQRPPPRRPPRPGRDSWSSWPGASSAPAPSRTPGQLAGSVAQRPEA